MRPAATVENHLHRANDKPVRRKISTTIISPGREATIDRERWRITPATSRPAIRSTPASGKQAEGPAQPEITGQHAEKDDQHSIESNFNIAEIAPPVLRYGATFFEDPQQEKRRTRRRAEGAVVKQRQQQRPGRGFTGGDEQIAVVELLTEAGALGFHTRQHPLGCPVEG